MPEPIGEHPAPHLPFWRQLLTNPVVIGAIITAYVTLNTAIFNYLSARNAQQMEREKFEFQASFEERKYETQLMLDIVKSANGDQNVMLHRLCALAATGLIPKAAAQLKLQVNGLCPAVPRTNP